MNHPTLFDPIQVGALRLPNRIIMAPLTRSRAGAQRIPNALMAEYYAQRATAGMIISEATSVTAMGVGYADTPGIWSQAQVEGWKLVTQAVHKAGGRILLQLWHVGRISDPMFLGGGATRGAQRDPGCRACQSGSSLEIICHAPRTGVG
jgi:2,4-dienoyl-CoA reductase-like NADH-dependent reductase (Old Yellow Enzyme family)